MAGKAGDVPGVVDGFVDDVQVEGAIALDEGEEPSLVEREDVEAEGRQPEEPHQGPGPTVGGGRVTAVDGPMERSHLVVEGVRGELLIPLAATRAGDKPDSTVVEVLKPEWKDKPDDPKAETEKREVKLGDTNFVDTVVLEGLTEGELIKVRGFETKLQFD